MNRIIITEKGKDFIVNEMKKQEKQTLKIVQEENNEFMITKTFGFKGKQDQGPIPLLSLKRNKKQELISRLNTETLPSLYTVNKKKMSKENTINSNNRSSIRSFDEPYRSTIYRNYLQKLAQKHLNSQLKYIELKKNIEKLRERRQKKQLSFFNPPQKNTSIKIEQTNYWKRYNDRVQTLNQHKPKCKNRLPYINQKFLNIQHENEIKIQQIKKKWKSQHTVLSNNSRVLLSNNPETIQYE